MYNEFVSQHLHNTYTHKDFGSTKIKEMGFSPDAFVQMAIQLAYKRMSGHFGATYESV